MRAYVSGKIFLVAALAVAIGVAVAIYSINQGPEEVRFPDDKATNPVVDYYPAKILRFVKGKTKDIGSVGITSLVSANELSEELEANFRLSSKIEVNLNWLEKYHTLPLNKRAEGVVVLSSREGADYHGNLIGFPSTTSSGEEVSADDLVIVTAYKVWCGGGNKLVITDKGGRADPWVHFVALR